MTSNILDEDLREFLIESSENLANLDREIVQLEQTPGDINLVSSVFRTIHSIKGTCGFFGLDRLGSLAHVTENILSQVRERKRDLTPELISLILEAVDEIKGMLASIESCGKEGEEHNVTLRVRLDMAQKETAEPGQKPAEPPPLAVSHAPKPISALLPPVPEAPPTTVVAAPTPSSAAAIAPAPAAKAKPAKLPKPAEPTPKKPTVDADKDANLADSTIRVDVKLLNKLMNLVGELVLARNQLLQDSSALNPTLQKTSQRLNLITSELQEGVMKTRMQPIGVVWNKLPRVVRDLAAKCGKSVQIEMEGAGTELDKTILEAIKDPLTHIVRNSCDHGIETPDVRIAKNKNPEGLLLLRAYHEGGVVNIEIADDGAGIDPERVKAKAIEKDLIRPEQAAQMSDADAIHLIFLPGFSTAAQVTSISGRGVGMDVVKTNIERIGGTVEVMNRPEAGTILRIKIPLTLAIIPGLVVKLEPEPGPGIAGRRPESEIIQVKSASEQTPQRRKSRREERFVIPQANLLELVRLEGPTDLKRIENVHGTPIFHHRGKLLPLAYLSKVLGRTGDYASREVINIVVLQAENQQMGLVVDHILDTQEIVVKPLGKQLKALTCYVGATIMGDGRPALILDVMGLAKLAGLRGQTRQAAQQPASSAPATRHQMLLLFQAGRFDRLAVPLSLVARLEEIPAEKIERAAGRLVLFYRGDILPLISLAHALEPSRGEVGTLSGTVQIVVFTNGQRRIGVIVDRILDIVNDAVTVKRSVPMRGLLGSAVVAGKVTDLIDLHALVEATGENWLDRAQTLPQPHRKVLLVDPSTAGRDMIHDFLDISGYSVLEAASIHEALTKARLTPVDLVITAVEMGGDQASGRDLADVMHTDATLRHIPILGLFDRADQIVEGELAAGPFDAHLVRADRGRLLSVMAELLLKASAALEVAQ